jgi:hypothetical protein
MAATFDSVKFNQLFKRVVNKYFNAFLAVEMSIGCKSGMATVQELSRRFNAEKEMYMSLMVEFSRGVFYLYSLVYDDSGIEYINDNVPTDIIHRNQSLFSLDLQMITTLVYLLNKNEGTTERSVQPIISTQ